ncbi:hypothetical protein PM076_01060 [Halorubrum ezzemoulense]|uniref:Uncharacterized protein n=1 Tax=Halorubrum ezzemoulense TaxID=337243 RepID=A0ABT4Z7K2_HALEZ|nr:hypothetical protein [Halorubrum ezzemoulense]MDB2244982.1 hypothetical protein [Halorubrum ezzemoulense]MDB2251189.1 hypothetical protein [Halorubrum ezzemoulense]MDB2278261.1 hypothetical protein [Halorubrum ezzemoulense]MDB2284935.1 hypothetical protein [Halorubrum ezzemoulense]MDB2288317.1 hypothetical protein [Halorubrum ezzemoulense]
MERRSLLKTIGGIGVTASAAGAGVLATSGGASAQSSVDITATSPGNISNDRGDLTKVTIDPSFRIEWDDFDTAVGKVMVLIEARTLEGGEVQGEGWTPILRMTPWLTEDQQQNGGPHIDYSKPGTTGHFEITGTIGQQLAYSSRVRTESSEPTARPIEVVNETGRPDYSSESFPDYSSVDSSSYLGGGSIGSATQNYDTIGSELVNNFPGTDAGYYGAAINTDNFDVPEDGTSDTDTVEIRYTFAFYTPTFAEGELESSWYENVRDSDLQDVNGNSKLVMDGEDGYPSVTDEPGVSSQASNNYDALQSIADSHPAVITTTTSFGVTVENEEAGTTITSGSTNTTASGGGQ